MRYLIAAVLLCLVVGGLGLFGSRDTTHAGGCYPVDVSSSGSGTASVTTAPDCGSGYGQGDTVDIQAYPDTGAKFDQWSGDCTGSGNPFEIISIFQSYNCTANFVDCHGVSVDVDPPGAGEASVTSAGDCPDGGYSPGAEVDIETSGYNDNRFEGWTNDCTGLGSTGNFPMPSYDVSCTAQYTLCHTVEVDITGSGSGLADFSGSDPCLYGLYDGSSADFYESPDSGSYFAGWSGDCSGTDSDYYTTINSDTSCTAEFEPCSQLTVDITGSGSVTPEDYGNCNNGTDYLPDQSTYLDAYPDSGWTFDSWGGDCSGYGSDTSAFVDFQFGNVNCTATFVQCSALDYSWNGSGDVQPTDSPDCKDGVSYLPTDTTTLVATPDPGWAFASWDGYCSGQGDNATVDFSGGDVSCTANFVQCFTLATDVNPPGAGSIDLSNNGNCHTSEYIDGTLTDLTAAPNSGYVFDYWSGDCSGTDPTYHSLQLDTDRTCTANFTSSPTDTPSPTPCGAPGPAGVFGAEVAPTPTPTATPRAEVVHNANANGDFQWGSSAHAHAD